MQAGQRPCIYDNICEVYTMAKSLMMLVNPAAGRSMSDLNLGTAVSTFALNGYCPTVFYTTAPGTASKIVEENAANYERLVCLGGDGTSLGRFSCGSVIRPCRCASRGAPQK
mgnify:CR=1 FL=1